MEDDDICDAALGLGLGLGDQYAPRPFRRLENQKAEKKPPVVCLDLSFALRPFADAIDGDLKSDGSSLKVIDREEYRENAYENNNNKNCGRKKLRLTKEQSNLLEDCFKVHSTLNPLQKQALAEQLNLNPRQVEVWFQNRRARTKLKQTEVDCEFLKKCCESLSDENQRLKKEVQELRSLKAATSSPLYIQLPKATLMCPSCETLTKAHTDGKNAVAGDVVRNRKSSNKLQGGNFDGKK